MPQDLFRKEVLEARQAGWLGGISLAQPPGVRGLMLAAVGISLAVALFLSFGNYTYRSRVVGQLVPSLGLVTVLAPASGVVSELGAAEGEALDAGDLLAVVTMPRATLLDGDTVTALRQQQQRRRDGLEAAQLAEQRLLDAKADGLAAQLAAAQVELAQVEAEVATRQQRMGIAEEILEQTRRLARERHVSELQLRQQQSAALEQLAELQLLQRQAAGTRRMITQLQHALEELPAQREASLAGLQRDLALLEQEQVETEARGMLAVSAPVAGTVATQLAKPGQAVQAGQPLVILLPVDSPLEAELLVPSRAIGFIEHGDDVLLRYQAFPYQKFGHHRGQVARISRSAINPGELGPQTSAGASGAEPFYRVTVTLAAQAVTAYGRAEPLKPGMLLEADVLGERRRLVEWVFEPLYSVKGRVFDG
jgi:membrane fusion protein